jgi:hypothetical protein
MSCSPNIVRDLYWKKINVPTGVEYNQPYHLVEVPSTMGNNEAAKQIDNHKWTNVRGYGNILVYQDTSNFPNVQFSVSPWNR